MEQADKLPIRKGYECWLGKSEKEQRESGNRDRWMNRPTFILASIGSAIGLGNFWRFPYLTYKYDGAFFFFPYLCALFLMGIPLLLMELSLGQKIQRGDISVFRGMNKRLAGIGLASVFSSYIITFYYTVIIAWSSVYIVAGFINPLPWSVHNNDHDWKCDPKTTSRAEEFFYKTIVTYLDDNCKPYEDGDPTRFSLPAFGGAVFTWLTIFFCVWRGVKSSSYIVWFTVPVPVIFIIVMIINGAQLEGAGDGIQQYLKGNFKKYEGVTPEVEAAMREADAIAREPVWSDATGQIFFSIGVCMGIMTSYGSYNDVKKPIIMDNFIISISNSMVSFISGFAVWSVVGYLQAIDSIAKSKTSSFGLAFVAYPTAIDTMNNSNAWAVLLGITLYLLGIDSAFSFVEATSTVITDTKWGSQWPRTFIAFVLCVFGFGLSLVFCTNFGFILLDVFDYYLSNGLLLVVGLLQCLGCGWGFDTEHIYNKSPRHANSLFALTMSYWTIIIMLGLICVPAGGTVGGLIAVLCSFPTIIMPISYYLLVPKESSFSEWYNDIFMCGVGRLGYSMSAITRKDPDVRAWWEPIFVFYYGFCIKYLCPCVLWFLNVSNIRNMIAKPYGGYSAGWQAVGIVLPVLGLAAFFFGTCLFVHEQPFDRDVFDEKKAAIGGASNNKVQDSSSIGDEKKGTEKETELVTNNQNDETNN